MSSPGPSSSGRESASGSARPPGVDAPGQGPTHRGGKSVNGHGPASGEDPKRAFGDIGAQFAELKDYASLLVATQVDRVKASARRAVLFAVAGILGLILLCVTVAAGAIRLFQGVAAGLAELFGGRVWLADLLTGVLLLALVATVIGLALTTWSRAAAKKTRLKYAEREALRRAGSTPK